MYKKVINITGSKNNAVSGLKRHAKKDLKYVAQTSETYCRAPCNSAMRVVLSLSPQITSA